MKYTYSIIAIFVISCCFTACKTTTIISPELVNVNFETECLGVELDGTQTLRVFGKGRNKADAIEQAKKNAIRDVLFKGINAGSGDCSKRPLLPVVNAQERYSYYFNPFFRDGGEYTKYVRLDEKRTSRIKSQNSTQENWGVVVTVNRDALQEKLINDDIIKPES